MISIGTQYNGPELSHAAIRKAFLLVSVAIRQECGPWVGTDDFGPCGQRPTSGRFFEIGAMPAVNVVFYVPGSIATVMPTKIEPARFSRKQKLLLVAVPVPPEMVNSSGALDFVMDSLHKANAIAAEVFAKKNVGIFDLARADELVEKARAEIATGKYEKQVADAIAKMSESTQNALAAIAKAKEASANKPK